MSSIARFTSQLTSGRARAGNRAILLLTVIVLPWALLSGGARCAQAADAVSFDPAVSYAVGSRPSSLAAGDFNSDGVPDLAVANRWGNSVSVLLGTGSGTFGAPASFAVGNRPHSVGIGDFNADGRPDLASADFGFNRVTIQLNSPIPPNVAPVADAGPDQVVTASSASGASVTLDGSASSDLDGDPLTYDWTGPFGAASGVSPTVTLPVGTHVVTLTVGDGQETATDTVLVTVQTPADAAQDLVDLVGGLGLPNGVANSLTAPLTQAAALLSDGNPNNDGAACGSLTAFMNQVSAKLANGSLTPSQAAQLTASALALWAALGC